MNVIQLNRRTVVVGASCAALAVPRLAMAQTKGVRYLHDWRWEGPGAPVLCASRGAFERARLDVSLAAGTGSAATVAKVAAGEFDVGLGDFSSLVEFSAKNPTIEPPMAVYVLYERLPATLFIRNTAGSRVSDLAGKKIGAPVFDGGRKLWPLFAQKTNAPAVTWVNLEPAQRERAFAQGEVDAITGFLFTSMLNIEREGFSGSKYTPIAFAEAGVRLYGNVLLVNPKFLANNGAAVKGFVRAYNSGLKDAIKATREAMAWVKAAEPKTDENLEWRRARLSFDSFVVTPNTRELGLGSIDMARVKSQITDITATLKLPKAVDANLIATDQFLPSAAERSL